MAAGRYGEAVPVYRELVAARPGDTGLLLNLGMALHLAGADREALEPLAAAHRLKPDAFPAALFLGAARLRLGQAQAALAPLRKAVRLQPADHKARSLLVDALLVTGRHAQAERHLVELSRLSPEDPGVWFSLGRTYEAIATRAFEALLARDSESAYTLALVAGVRLDEGHAAAALDLYRKAIERAPGMRGLHADVAQLYRETHHPDEAAEEEEKERRLPKPDCARTPLECRFAEGKHREVITGAARAQTPAAHYWLARSGNELAREAFARLEALPASAPLHEWRAGQLRNEGRYAESAEEWRKSIGFTPGDARLRQELAVTLRLNQDLGGAQSVLEELLRRAPDAASANYLIGDVLLARQQAEASIPPLEKAVRLDPGLTHALGALGRAYALVGRPAEAIPQLEKALPIDEDGSLRFQLARAYQAVGRITDAERALAEWERFRKAASAASEASAKKLAITPP